MFSVLKYKFFKKEFLSEVAILIGNLLDHYDTSLYAFLVPVLAPIFFPDHAPVVQLILAYSILATSIVTRPIGAIIFGLIACKRGPIFGLSYSLIGVAITSILLGCLPGYETIGYFAPLSLIVVRMFRGIFASGESAIAKLYIIEHKTQNNALKSSFFYDGSVILGILLASVVSTIVYNCQYINAWRICCWLGGSVGLVGVFLRYFSWEHKQLDNQKLNNFNKINWIVLWQNKYNIFKIALLVGFTHITYYLAFISLNSIVPLVANIKLAEMLNINNYLLIFDLLMIFMVGAIILKYKFNPAKTMLFASLMLLITIVPIFNGLANATILLVTLFKLWIIIWGVVFVCPLNFWCEQLVTKLPEKYFLVGVGSSIGGACIGKTLTAVCLCLWYKTDILWVPAVYIAGLMFGVVVVVWVGVTSSGRLMRSLKSVTNVVQGV